MVSPPSDRSSYETANTDSRNVMSRPTPEWTDYPEKVIGHQRQRFARHLGLFVLLVCIATEEAAARSMPSRTIRVRQLPELIRTADIIAQVRITAAEGGERYEPVYRARVEESLKGVPAGTILHLGGSNFTIGQVFLVFLRQLGTVRDRLRESEFSRSFPAEAPYYDIETELFGQFQLVVTQAFGEVDVAASFAREWVILPESLRVVVVDCTGEEPKALVLRDHLFDFIRNSLRSEERMNPDSGA